MQSPSELAQQVVSLITPLLPHLLSMGTTVAGAAGSKAFEEVGKGVGGVLTENVQKLWHRISPKLLANAETSQTLSKLAEAPGDAKLRKWLVGDLERLLERDNALRAEIAECVPSSSYVIHAAASQGSISISGVNVSNNQALIVGRGKAAGTSPEETS